MNNLEMMRKRFEWQGGVRQEDRMIKDKLRTLQRALRYSYQACTIEMVQPYSVVLDADPQAIDTEMGVFQPVRALINPDKVKQDYDDKIISIEHRHEFGPGDVFEWKKTDSYWIIYTEEITEDAYFRGEIRRCRYKLKFKDEDGNWCSTWAAIRGPVETAIDSIQKNQERIDKPNLSLNILIPQNEKTLHAFDRYQEFIFAGRAWRVEAPDSISMKNIIEVNAGEDYINLDTDDMQNEMKNGLVIELVEPEVSEDDIQGETFIKPLIAETYSVNEEGGTWSVLEQGAPVRICADSDNSIQLTWLKSTQGQFTLLWTKDDKSLERTIVVESLY